MFGETQNQFEELRKQQLANVSFFKAPAQNKLVAN